MIHDELEEWHFDFGLCATKDNQMLPRSKCEELQNVIIKWAESNELGVGGGYREYAEKDIQSYPIK